MRSEGIAIPQAARSAKQQSFDVRTNAISRAASTKAVINGDDTSSYAKGYYVRKILYGHEKGFLVITKRIEWVIELQ